VNNNSFSFLGLPNTDLQNLAILDKSQFGGDMDQLNDAGTYFDLGPRKMTQNGVFHYVCTRNNAFSNRSQKGWLYVTKQTSSTKTFDLSGGTLTLESPDSTFAAASISVTPGSMQTPNSITIQSVDANIVVGFPSTLSSLYYQVTIQPTSTFDNTNTATGDFTIQFSFSDSNFKFFTMYRASTINSNDWQSVSGSPGGGQVTLTTNKGGVYAVGSTTNTGAIIGIIFGTLIGVAVLLFAVYWFFYRRRKNFEMEKEKMHAGATSSDARA